MTTTPRLGAPELPTGQNVSETTVNEITRYIEAFAARVVVDKDRTAPAGTEVDGDCFIVPTSPTGAWTGKANNIAIKISTAFVFVAPFAGLTMFVQDEAVSYRYSGSAWAAVAGGGTAASLDYDTDGTLAANSDSKLATQKAAKTYVDAKVAGLSWKQAVRAATTSNGTLSTAFANGQAIDGVTLATGDRILIKNQSTAADNGIYVVAASGAPARATDADSGVELVNASCYVSEGTANADTQWTCTTNATITVGSTSLTFAQVNASSFSVSGNEATSSEMWTGSSSAKVVTPKKILDAAVPTALTDAATVTPDFNTGFNFEWTIGGSRTLANPTNTKSGQSGTIKIVQDATGSRVITYGNNWRFPGGSATAGVLSTAANAIDLLAYTVGSDGKIYATLAKAFAA
jgi:hypothetical protein